MKLRRRRERRKSGHGSGASRGRHARAPGWRGLRRWALPAGTVLVAFIVGYLAAARLLFPAPESGDGELVSVPDVEGMAFEDAVSRLEAAGLDGRVLLRAAPPGSGAAPPGRVLGQDPMAGQLLSPGEAVELIVGRGGLRLAVPGLTGLAADTAGRVLGRMDFTVERTTEPSPLRRGAVVATEPPAGTEVTLPTRVTLVVSEGPEVAEVPELVGRHVADAEAALAEAGLRLGAVEFDPRAAAAPGRIIGQSPPGGYALRQGGTVSIRVAGTRDVWERREGSR